MKAYSRDIRLRIVRTYRNVEDTRREIAAPAVKKFYRAAPRS
jgi:hypothetical protein